MQKLSYWNRIRCSVVSCAVFCSVLPNSFVFAQSENAAPLSSVWVVERGSYHGGVRIFDLRPVDFSTPGEYEFLITSQQGGIFFCHVKIEETLQETYNYTCDVNQYGDPEEFDLAFGTNRTETGIGWYSDKIFTYLMGTGEYTVEEAEKNSFVRYSAVRFDKTIPSEMQESKPKSNSNRGPWVLLANTASKR